MKSKRKVHKRGDGAAVEGANGLNSKHACKMIPRRFFHSTDTQEDARNVLSLVITAGIPYGVVVQFVSQWLPKDSCRR